MAEPVRRPGSPGTTFEALYRAHYREVLAYFARRLPRTDAEDATADVFTILWRRSDELPRDTFTAAWVFGTAHRVLANHLRRRRRSARLFERVSGLATADPATPEMQVLRSVEDQLLLNALDQLRRKDRELLKLATWEKLPYRTIASILGISEAAVGQRISRARKRLASELERGPKPRSRPSAEWKGETT